MEPTLKTLSAMTLVGVSGAFIPEKTNMTVIPQLWDMLRKRGGEIKNIISGPSVGLINCLPLLSETDEKMELVYMAAVPVASLDNLPAGMWATTVPAAQYAVFCSSVKNDQINKVIDYAYGDWLPKSGYTRAAGPELEFYAADFHPVKKPEFDYAVPIRK